jgi:ADP-ribose pyrophosphatase YjhB (NUDIX family)
VTTTRISAHALVLDDDRRILLCRIASHIDAAGHWTLPGGGLGFGETPEAGALREVEEESGLTVVLDGLAGTFNAVVDRPPERGGPMHWVSILYRARPTGGELRDELEDSTDTCAWFAEAEARVLPLVRLSAEGLDLAFGKR